MYKTSYGFATLHQEKVTMWLKQTCDFVIKSVHAQRTVAEMFQIENIILN
jgi:hypothetical protein